MKKFKLHIVREGRAAIEDSKAIPADEKDIAVTSLSTCEAIVVAHKQYPDYSVVNCEEVAIDVPGDKPKRVQLDKTSFKTETEWKSAQMDMDNIDYNVALEIAEKRGWKITKENN